MRFSRKLFRRSFFDRMMNTFRLKKHTPLRVKLLTTFAIISLLMSGLTFAVGGVGAAIVWPSAPAGEASGGTIMSYFKNAFGDASTQTQKVCTNSGVIRGFRVDGTPVCASLSELSGGASASTTPPTTTTLPPTTTTTSTSLSFTFSGSSTSITSGASATLTWSTTNATSCTASNGWSGSKAIGNNRTETITPTTTTTYRLTCTESNGTSSSQDVTVNVTQPLSFRFLASSSSITSGASTTLTWSTTNATACTASNGWSGSKAIGNNRTETVSPTTTTTYRLTCTGSDGTSSMQDVTVNVTQPPSISFSASSPSITSGASTTLTWSTTNATACTASNGWSGSKAVGNNKTETVSPTTTTTYRLTCTGSDGTSSMQDVTVNVANPIVPTIAFTTSSGTVNNGQSVTLSWSISNATDTCTATNFTPGADKLTNGTFTTSVTPSNNTTTTYRIRCNGESRTLNIVAKNPSPPPVISFYISSFSERSLSSNGVQSVTETDLTSEQNVILEWNISNASSCTIENDSGLPSYSINLISGASNSSNLFTPKRGAKTVYTITCYGQGGVPAPLQSVGIHSRLSGCYNYTESSDKVTITAYSMSSLCPKNVEIPNMIDGKIVQGIGEDAFSRKQLTSVTIPDSVVGIGFAAFADNQLTSIVIGGSVKYIGNSAFAGNQLTSVTIPDSVEKIDNNAFKNNKLTSLIIGKNVQRISYYAFYNNYLDTITFSGSATDPSSMQIIDEHAFREQNISTWRRVDVYGPAYGYVRDLMTNSAYRQQIFDTDMTIDYKLAP